MKYNIFYSKHNAQNWVAFYKDFQENGGSLKLKTELWGIIIFLLVR